MEGKIMGMDVMGVNASSEKGEYFRRNVWGWRPLWDYVEEVHPEIAQLVQYGHSNDGDGLNALNSVRLAEALLLDYTSGKAQEYVEKRNAYLEALPMVDCNICSGTGIRSDTLGVEDGQPEKELSKEIAKATGRTKGWCNGCDGLGKNKDWATSYYLDEQDIKEFAEFLQDCGGFEIW
jgi:hypothetical protein